MKNPNPAPAHPASAIVVEDQPDARDWLAASVRQAFAGARVRTAGSLREARAALRYASDDLALVDIGLPDGNGIDLVREIAAASPRTIAIVTTVFGDDEHLFAALRAGAQGYVLKDESKANLAVLLEDILHGKPPLSPAIARRLLGHFHEEVSGEVKLTDRECEVLTLLAKGLTLARVAELLGITRNTAAGYLKLIYRKLEVSSRAEAALEAARRGLVHP